MPNFESLTLLAIVPISALLAIAVSLLASLAVTVLIWRRRDPLALKIAVTVVAFLPVVGPLFALWILSFPDRMHPALQATHPKMVNTYSSPHVTLLKPKPRWHAAWRRRVQKGKPGNKGGDAA